MGIMGYSAVLFIYLTSLIACVLKSEIASQIVNLSNLTVVFMGSLVGAYTIGQSFVDWKHGSSYSQNDSNTVIKEEKTVKYDVTLEQRYQKENSNCLDYPPTEWIFKQEK